MTQLKVSPANGKERITEKNRVPMSTPQQKLAHPEIPGYHCHWMRGTPERLEQAYRAGYTFVDESEARLNNFDLGGDAKISGNTDLGTRVSTLASTGGGDIGTDGQPIRMYLMKIPLEWFNADQEVREDKTRQLYDMLASNQVPSNPHIKSEDKDKSYVKSSGLNHYDMYKQQSYRRT